MTTRQVTRWLVWGKRSERDSNRQRRWEIDADAWLETRISGAHYVYVLADPRSMEVRYVGVTRDPDARKFCHSGGGASTTKAWIREVIQSGHKPIMTLIDVADGERQGYKRERQWIRHFREAGANLLNVR